MFNSNTTTSLTNSNNNYYYNSSKSSSSSSYNNDKRALNRSASQSIINLGTNWRTSVSNSKWSTTMHDWMKTVRSPTRYRVGDNRFNFHFRHSIKLALMTVSGLFGLCLIYFLLSSNNNIKPKSPLDDTSSSGADSGPSLSKTLLKVIYEAYNDGVSRSILLFYLFPILFEIREQNIIIDC